MTCALQNSISLYLCSLSMQPVAVCCVAHILGPDGIGFRTAHILGPDGVGFRAKESASPVEPVSTAFVKMVSWPVSTAFVKMVTFIVLFNSWRTLLTSPSAILRALSCHVFLHAVSFCSSGPRARPLMARHFKYVVGREIEREEREIMMMMNPSAKVLYGLRVVSTKLLIVKDLFEIFTRNRYTLSKGSKTIRNCPIEIHRYA